MSIVKPGLQKNYRNFYFRDFNKSINTNFLGKLYSPKADSVSFTSLYYTETESNKLPETEKINSALGGYGHTTSFFRDLDTLKFICQEVQTRFPEGTEIRDYGCSNGEEPLTLLMLLNPDPNNVDKRYTIKGFDISKGIIETAKRYTYGIRPTTTDYIQDDFLLKDNNELSIKELRLKKLFNKYLKPIFKPIEYNIDDIKDERSYAKLTENKNTSQVDDKTSYFKLINNPDFAKVLQLYGGNEIGDISNLANVKINKDNRPGVIIFKNAWYHITGNCFIPKDNTVVNTTINELNFDLLNKTIKGIHDNLQDGGLLVVGNSTWDHYFYKNKNRQNKIGYKQNPFYQALEKNNFRPVKWELAVENNLSKEYLEPVPTVWAKTLSNFSRYV